MSEFEGEGQIGEGGAGSQGGKDEPAGPTDAERAEAGKFDAMVSEGKLTPAEMAEVEKDKTPEEVETEKEVDEVLKNAEEDPRALHYFNNFFTNLPGGHRDVQTQKELEKDPDFDVNQTFLYSKSKEKVTLRQFRLDIEEAIAQSGLDPKEIRRMQEEKVALDESYQDEGNEESLKRSGQLTYEIIRYIIPVYIKLRSWGYDKRTLCK